MLRSTKLHQLAKCVNAAKRNAAILHKANSTYQRHQSLSYLYASQRCLSFSFQHKFSQMKSTNHTQNRRNYRTSIFSNNNTQHSSNNKFNNSINKHSVKRNNSNLLFRLSKHSFSNLPEHEVVGLPALSPSVETSKIVEWKKKEGDFLEENEAIAVVQTDKAELDWQLTDEAWLAKILLEPGDTVPVGTPACIFVENESDIAAFANYNPSDTGSSSSGAAASSEPATPPPPSQPEQSTQQPSGGGGGGGSGPPTNLPEYTVEGLPALSPTATDGAIVEWLVQEGDMVEEGTGIAEIQTDKSVVTWAATDEAYIAKLLHPVAPDTKLDVGTPLAVLVENKADVAAFANIDSSVFGSTGSAGGAPEPEPAAQETQAPAQQGELHSGRTPSIQFRYGVRAAPQQQATGTTGSKRGAGERIFASPYARTLARELGVDLSLIESGSGARGRITATDVEAAAKAPPKAAAKEKKQTSAAAPVSFEISTADRSFEDIPMTVMREVIAKRLSESKFTSPHYYVTFEFELDNLLKMRADMNDGEEVRVSINDFLVKACALALRQVPMANVSWHGEYLRRYNYVDISVAVATPTGLITPIVKDADLKGLRAISGEVKDLAKRAKDNKLLPHEFQGGTFTISNLGMFGVNQFTAIINPPQSCILAVGGGNQTLKPDNSNAKGFRTATTMYATLSSDHRSVDGALAAQYMSALRTYIEHPSKMLL